MLFSSDDWDGKGWGWGGLTIFTLNNLSNFTFWCSLKKKNILSSQLSYHYKQIVPLTERVKSKMIVGFREKMMLPWRFMCIWYKGLNCGWHCGSCWQQWGCAWAGFLGSGFVRAQTRDMVHPVHLAARLQGQRQDSWASILGSNGRDLFCFCLCPRIGGNNSFWHSLFTLMSSSCHLCGSLELLTYRNVGG